MASRLKRTARPSAAGDVMYSINKRSNRKEWTVIIVIAVLVHVVLFFSIKPGFFAAFQKKPSADDVGGGQGQPMPPHTIISIPIEIVDVLDEDEQEPVQEVAERRDREEAEQEEVVRPVVEEGSSEHRAIDIEALVGEAAEAMPGNTGEQPVVIPPRPIEITWPDTRGLKHCLGHFIDVQIQVGEHGEVLQVAAKDDMPPEDCVQAALESARRIVFEPGRRDGRAATLWTEVRIEFRKKK